MFHLITHAFFKALLFMGAGSVIHGCHDEQNIRKMGGLKADMPLTFVTYAAGMLALCGVPIFAGFWSKDGILEAGSHWSVSKGPVALLIFGALLTAFYMTRQVAYVFFGHWRGNKPAHESPAVMTIPLIILAVFACVLGLLGTPAWPWFQGFLNGRASPLEFKALLEANVVLVMATSTGVVLLGIFFAWWLYGGKSLRAEAPDVLERAAPLPWAWLRNRLYIDEIYAATFIAFYAWWARVADWLDRRVWGGAVSGVAMVFRGWAQLNRLLDANVVDGTFDKGCEELSTSGGLLSRMQNGQVQAYLRWLALGVVVLAAILIWSSRT
jgi:NADH-quinone oxidoreductase subunit L